MTPCGCRIICNPGLSQQEQQIVYCPLHALAPRMLEFIKRISEIGYDVDIEYRVEEARSIVSEIEKENV